MAHTSKAPVDHQEAQGYRWVVPGTPNVSPNIRISPADSTSSSSVMDVDNPVVSDDDVDEDYALPMPIDMTHTRVNNEAEFRLFRASTLLDARIEEQRPTGVAVKRGRFTENKTHQPSRSPP